MLKKMLVKEIIGPILIIICSIILYNVVCYLIKKIFKVRTKKQENKKYMTVVELLCNVIKYFIMVIALLMILEIYGIDTKAIIASLGAVSLVIGLAFQDTIKDLISGFTIIFEGQFRVGDTVTINNFKGEVIALGLKTTKLKSYTGEYCFIANRLINDVINHSLESSLAIVDISISYEDDIDKAILVLENMCLELNSKLKGLKENLQVLGVEKLDSSSIVIRIIGKTEPMKHYEIQRELLKNVKNTLDSKKISIPYQHVVVVNE